MIDLKKFPEQNAFIETNVVLPDTIKTLVKEQNWPQLDQEFIKLFKKDALLFKHLQSYLPQLRSIEFIINIRDSKNEYEEDGIWHDDGSRELAFSIGLNQASHQIEGGKLFIRKKNSNQHQTIDPPLFGQCYIFKTGIWGFEHKVSAVTNERRIVIAGWCSL